LNSANAEHQSEVPQGIKTLLFDKGFLAFWVAGTLIGVIRWLQLLALSVYTLEITASPFLVSMVPLLFMAPMALTGPLWGVVADRTDRKHLFIGTTALVCSVSLIMAYVAYMGELVFGHIAIASLLAGVFWATDMPIRRRLIGDLSGNALAPAMSLDAATGNATRMLGPLLGGLTLQLMGIAGVFVFSFVCYTIVLLLVASVQLPQIKVLSKSTTSLFNDLAGGVRLVSGDVWLKLVLSVTIVFNIFGFAFTSMIPVLGARQLKLDPFWVGVLSSLEGLGAFIGAIMVALIARPEIHFKIYFRGVAVYLALVGVLAGLAINISNISLPFIACGAVLVGIGIAGACFSAMQSTLSYLAAPPAFRSRVLGVLTLCIGTAPIGFFCIGWVAEQLSAPIALCMTSLFGLAALAFVRFRYRLAGSIPPSSKDKS
jgi:MFS family permease